MKNISKILFGSSGLFVLSLIPSSFVFSQYGGTDTVEGFVDIIIDLLFVLVIVLLALAFLIFIWGLAKFILALKSGGSDEDIKNGKRLIVWGVIAFLVLFSLSSILAVITGTFDFYSGGIPFLPEL